VAPDAIKKARKEQKDFERRKKGNKEGDLA